MKRILSCTLINLFTVFVLVSSWVGEYQRRIRIELTNQSIRKLTDYSIELEFSTSNLIELDHLGNDCNDLYFTSTTDDPIEFWLESGCNSLETIVWIRIENLEVTSTKDIFMYYGDPTKSKPQGEVWGSSFGFMSLQECEILDPPLQTSASFHNHFPLGGESPVYGEGKKKGEHSHSILDTITAQPATNCQYWTIDNIPWQHYPIFVPFGNDPPIVNPPTNLGVGTTISHYHDIAFLDRSSAEESIPPYYEVTFCSQYLNGSFGSLIPSNAIAMFEHKDDIPNWEFEENLNNEERYARGTVVINAFRSASGGSPTHSHFLPDSSFTIHGEALSDVPPGAVDNWGFCGYGKFPHNHTTQTPLCHTGTSSNEPPYLKLVFRYVQTPTKFIPGMITFHQCQNNIDQPTCELPPLGWERYTPLDGRFPRGTSVEGDILENGGTNVHQHPFTCTTGYPNPISSGEYGYNNGYAGDGTPGCSYNHTHEYIGMIDEEHILPSHNIIIFIKRIGSSDVSSNFLQNSVEWRCFDVLFVSQSVCSNRGECVGPNNCSCDENYWGESCERWSCFGVEKTKVNHVCSKLGECLAHDICKCDSNYGGPQCQFPMCYGILSNESEMVCSGNGICLSPDNCNCFEDAEWVGDECQIPMCNGVRATDEKVCSSHGECIHSGKCSCENGYFDEDCGLWECNNNLFNTSSACHGHGDCINPDNCTCGNYELFYGDFCGEWKCFDVERSEVADVCSGEGTCINHDECSCDENVCGMNCEFYVCGRKCSSDPTSVCSNRGKCTGPSNCSCDTHYFYGGIEQCDQFNCFGILKSNPEVCSNGRGDCISHNNCECDDGYFGEECLIWGCFEYPNDNDNVCSKKGQCVSHDNCVCDEKYCGKDCGHTICNGICGNESTRVCSGHGDCDFEQPGICECSEGYYPGGFGGDCYLWNCSGVVYDSPTVCNFQSGECISPDNCACGSGYSGLECEYWECNGFPFNDYDNVCNNHGDCVRPDSCSCEPKYHGEDCSDWDCYYREKSSKQVCSGHGTCVAADDCQCTDIKFFGGDLCKQKVCWNVSATDVDNICGSGHGNCVADDVCSCYLGYNQKELNHPCVIFFCGFETNSDANVCSGRGTCVDWDECICSDGFEGDICETWSCGSLWTESRTCSGHGDCLSPSICDCSNGWEGKLCGKNSFMEHSFKPLMASVGGVGGFVVCVNLLCCLVCCCCCCFVVALLIFTLLELFGLGSFLLTGVGFSIRSLYQYQGKIEKFEKLGDVDMLLKEHEIEHDDSSAHIRINKALFQIPFEEIEVDRVLGEGGSESIVFKAFWKSNAVAFKCFRTRRLCDSQDRYDEFEREVLVLASLSHPNVITFYGASLKPPRVGIVMEFCEHGDLDSYLVEYQEENGIRCPLKEKLRFLFEICLSLEYLHSRNVIHRDLKLENVLIDSQFRCKLMDFGLSRIIERRTSEEDLKLTKKIGTSVYIAPEVVSSNGSYDQKCDVFSFSILSWIVITENRYPYNEELVHGIEFRVSNDPNMRPSLEELEKECKSQKIQKSQKYGEPELIFEKKRIQTFLDIVSSSWSHKKEERMNFDEIVVLFEKEILLTIIEPLSPPPPPFSQKQPSIPTNSFKKKKKKVGVSKKNKSGSQNFLKEPLLKKENL